MDSKALHEGYLLKNKEYRIISLLGQGGFGITYLAEQIALSRKVAIKEFFMKENCNRDENTSEVSVPSVGSRELVNKFRQKFLREARMIAKLDNPHIVKIHDVFEENGTAYYVMEYFDGGSLVDEVKQRGPMSESKALGYVSQVADALGYLHGKNILHFDIKPANILIGNAGQATLIDFGISKHYDAGGGQTSSTPVGISKGYAPLEQYQQGEITTFTPATDIYALGATLYYLLLGQTPPSASEVNEEGLTGLPAHLSVSVRKAIEKAMSPRRKDRPQSVKEFLALLDVPREVSGKVPVSDEETKVNPVPQPSSVSQPSSSRRKSYTGLWIGLCSLVGIGVLAALLLMTREPVSPSPSVSSSVPSSPSEASSSSQASAASVAPAGSLRVSSSPSGALIWLDGKNTGKNTPELLESLSAGKHSVLLKLDGYEDVSREVDVTSSRRTECNLKLSKKSSPVQTPAIQTGMLKVSSSPSGASIWLDGKNTGKSTPEILEEIVAGSHKIVLKLDGYKDGSKQISVVSGKRAECSIKLTQKPQSVQPSVSSTKRDFTETVLGINMKMVYVKGGTFRMGATLEQGDDVEDWEKPVHSVILSDYYIGKFEVTQGLWKAVMGSNPSYFSRGDDYPVESVSWNDIQTFLTKLNQQTGKNYALPTEAQWEYAARGGAKSERYKYSGSHTIGDVAWFSSNSSSSTHPVGTKQPNELGIYDMSGNVWEWCSDWMGSYSSESQTNPTGPFSGSYRVLRGGSWGNGARGCRVSYRSSFDPDFRNFNFGFRVVLLP